MRLHKLYINNFKFFPKQDPNSPLLEIDGKNLLIYGENGSGKSTIYWALYTLLESSLKENNEHILKYFDKRNSENLVNIFSKGRTDAFIEAVLKDGLTTKTFRVSGKKKDLAIRSNSDVQESSMASDFINYRVLFQLHNLKHSKDNDLWPWFYDEVFPYVKIKSVPCLQQYKRLMEGPEKVMDLNGNEILPTESLRKSKIVQEAKNFRKYQDYVMRLRYWNSWLHRFLKEISATANKLIEKEFKYDFKIRLELEYIPFKNNNEIKYRIVENNVEEYISPEFELYPPKIIISLTEYQGEKNPKIKRLHTFLNEAKWSAIGLAIRFAVLDFKLYSADLKVLVIDDMLISLDMSNRDIVSKLLLNKYSNDYQLIIMTHDRSYFNWLNFELDNRELIDEKWKVLEMYADEVKTNKSKVFEKPLILASKSELAIAKNHFSNHDYASAANYLRKHSENILCSWLPEQYWKDKEKPDNSNAKMALRNIVDNGIKFLIRLNQSPELYKELRKYIRILLNPLSHSDVGVNRYRIEIRNIFQLLSDINSFHNITKFKTLVAGGDELEIRIHKPSTNQIFVYRLCLNDSLYEYCENNTKKLSKCLVNSMYCYPIESDNSVAINSKNKFEYFMCNELYEVYSKICDFEPEFIIEKNIRPYLFDTSGNNI